MLTDYHTGMPSLIAALALLGAALLMHRRLRPGGQAVLWLAVLSFALTVLHPNHKARCLHSWLPALWAAAGMGAAGLVYGPWTARLKATRPWLAGAAAVGLLLVQGPAVFQDAHAEEGGPHPRSPSVLELSDYYLPELDHAASGGHSGGRPGPVPGRMDVPATQRPAGSPRKQLARLRQPRRGRTGGVSEMAADDADRRAHRPGTGAGDVHRMGGRRRARPL